MCNKCNALQDRYNAAAFRLYEYLTALRAARGTPNFQSLQDRADSMRREVLAIKSEMDRHQHEHHSLN